MSDNDKKTRSKIAAKKYRESHKEKIKQDQKKYRNKNRDKLAEYSIEYYKANKELISDNHKKYYDDNKEDIKQKVINYYESNKDGTIREYRELNKTKKSQYNKEYYMTNLEKLTQYRHRHEQKKTLKSRFRTAKGSAKKRNLEFILTFDQYSIEVIKPCYYCADYFKGNEIGTGVGLDRVNNSKGYIIENVVPCCAHCNYLKSDIYSVEQTKAMIKTLIDMKSN